MILSPQQIFQVARGVGFEIDVFVAAGVSVAEAMTAVAMRESGGDTGAFNGNSATGDRSYGLWQINMLRKKPDGTPDLAATAALMKDFGITEEKQLWDARENAHAAWVLYAKRIANLGIAWRLGSDVGDYQARYEAHLPAAQAAALASAEGV